MNNLWYFSHNTEVLIPTVDGQILFQSPHLMEEGSRMRKTSVTARVLTENTPFVSEGDHPMIFTGIILSYMY